MVNSNWWKLKFRTHAHILICTILTFPLLSSFSELQSNPTTIPQATVELTEIVDKATQLPISENIITLRWETSNGEVIEEEIYTNQASLQTSIPADGNTRLWIMVESQGYKPWENAIRLKLNEDKPLYIKVEMVRQTELQG